MLHNLLTSLEVTLPIFAVILLGWAIRRKGIVDGHFVERANELIFKVALPVKLFLDVSQSDLRGAMHGSFVLVAVGGTLAGIVLAWLLGSALLRDPAEQGAFIHASFRGNFAYVGLTLLQNLVGDSVTALGAVVMATIVPIYNIAAIVVLSLKKRGAHELRFGQLVLGVLKTPMIVGILLALPLSLLGVQFPFVVSKSLGYLSTMVAPLALLCVGASVNLGGVRHSLRAILPACAFKLVLQPLLMVPAGIALGLPSAEVLVLLVVAGTPAAVNVFIVTQRMGGDGELASGVVVMSTALSIFTLTLWLFALKTLGVW